MNRDGQDARVGSGEDGLAMAAGQNESALKSYAEESRNDDNRREEGLVLKRNVAEEGEQDGFVEKEQHEGCEEKSADSREVEVIGTLPENSEEADEQDALVIGGDIEDEGEEEVRDEKVLQGEEVGVDVNVNKEMPTIAKDLPQDDSGAEEPEPSVPLSEDIEQEESDATDPAIRKVVPAPEYISETNRTQEPEKRLNDAPPTPMTHSAPNRVGKSGWNGRKSAGVEDPHGVQEVLDGLPLWREDSLRANYPTTTAYRVAIKKKRSTTIGNTIAFIFCAILVVGVVSSLSIYFVRSLSTAVSNVDLLAGTAQGAQPTNQAQPSTTGAENAAPLANGRVLAGYQWINDGTKHELYIDGSNHIQELASSDGQHWRITDLTQRSGAALANGRALAGFEWQHGNSQQVVYIDAKRHIQQLSSNSEGQWDVSDLTRKAQAPFASGTAITGYEWTPVGSKQVVYIDLHGHIQELASGNGTDWHASDLTALTKAPAASEKVIAAYQWARLGSKQVDYIDINQHVHELSFIEGSWQDTDLNGLVGAPLANGKTLVGYQWRQTGVSQIGYLDTNNHIQLLSSASAGNWSLVDLTQLVKAPVTNGNALVGYEWQQGERSVLYFIDGSDHIQEISDAPGENWQLADLNQFTLSAPPPNGKVLFGYDWAQHGSKQVVYIDNKNTVRELTSSNIPGRWDLSS